MNFDERYAHNHPSPFPPAPDCYDQLPLISPVGIGFKGDSYIVEPGVSTDSEFHLVGKRYSELDREWSTEWISDNLSAGKLKYQYNLRPYTIPQTFTITFSLERPGGNEWQFTTPAIPYIWDADGDGEADVDGVVGVGVGTVFLKEVGDEWDSSNWSPHTEAQAHASQEKMVYPTGWDRDDLNAPEPYRPYAVALEVGIGGDIPATTAGDIAKIVGISKQQVLNIIADMPNQIQGLVNGNNLKDYIDKNDNEIRGHTGFYNNSGAFGPSAGASTYSVTIPANKITGAPSRTVTCDDIKDYIDAMCEKAYVEGANSSRDYAKNFADDLLNAIYASGTPHSIGADGHITWASPMATSGGALTTHIPVGNMNVYSNVGGAETADNFIRTAADGKGDIKAI